MLALAKSFVPARSRQRLRAWVCLPQRILLLIAHYYYDLKQFTRYSSTLQFFNSKQQQQAWIDADSHKLEKGLALKAPRPGFGKGVAERLLRELAIYRSEYTDDMSVQNAVRALMAYRDFNLKHDVDYSEIFQSIQDLKHVCGPNASGGFVKVTKDEWMDNAQIDLTKFFKSRRSVRNFTEEPVLLSDIQKAVRMAMNTPTVCNRQAVKVHAYTDYSEVQTVIKCQQGNSGFGEGVQGLLMVTVDRSSFFSECERNQCWIDGGLFSMSLVYALHSIGLGSCCLNWSVSKSQDELLRHTIALPNNQAVIMMIAVGHLKEEFNVAVSPRKSMEHFLVNGIQKNV